MIERVEDLDILSASERRALVERLSTFHERIHQYLVDLHATVEFDSRFEVDISQHRATRCFHASSTAYYLMCPRRAWYDLNGDPALQDLQERGPSILNLNQGHSMHGLLQHLIQKMSDDGRYGISQFESELGMFREEEKLSGHMDGFFYLEDPVFDYVRLGLEIKTAQEKYWLEVEKSKAPMRDHISQASCYCHHFEAPIMLFLYFNKNKSQLLSVPHLHQPEEWDKIRRLLSKIQTLEEPPAKIVSWKCQDCKHRTVCQPTPRR